MRMLMAFALLLTACAGSPSASSSEPAAPAPQGGEILLQDNFDKLSGKWERFLNYWRLKYDQWYHSPDGGVEGGCLKHDLARGVPSEKRGAHDAMMIWRGGEEWTDYRVKAKVKLDSGASIGIWVRAGYEKAEKSGLSVKGYLAVVRPRKGNFRLWRMKTEGKTAYHFSDPDMLKQVENLAISMNKWIDMEVTVKGMEIAVKIDGREVVKIEDANFPKGSVGFFCYKVKDASWDNLVVEKLK